MEDDVKEKNDKEKGASDAVAVETPESTQSPESAAPAESAKSAEPAETAKSAKPAESAEPAKSAEPAESAETAKSAEPAEPAETAKSAEPAESAKSAEPAESAKSAEPAEPAESAKSAEPAESAKSAEPAEPAKSAESAKSAEPAESAKSAEPAESAKSAEPAESAETAKPAEPEKSAEQKRVKLEKKRLFLAIVPSVEVATKIALGIGTMRKRANDVGVDVKWVAPANLHLTLKFLGWTNVELIGAVSDMVTECLVNQKGFELQVAGVGAFPDDGQARVLWAGVKPDDQGALVALAKKIDQGLATVGIAAAEREFHPHVTMGRAKKDGVDGARDLISPFAGVTFGQSLVREVVLYESTPQSVGAEYVVLRRFALEVPAYRLEPMPLGEDQDADSASGATDH